MNKHLCIVPYFTLFHHLNCIADSLVMSSVMVEVQRVFIIDLYSLPPSHSHSLTFLHYSWTFPHPQGCEGLVGQELFSTGGGLEGRILRWAVRQSYIRVPAVKRVYQPSNYLRTGRSRKGVDMCMLAPSPFFLSLQIDFSLLYLVLSCLVLSCLVLSSLALTYSAFSNLIKLNLSHFIFFLLQSFRNLNASSPCDHVYLEMRLAIELKVCDMMS